MRLDCGLSLQQEVGWDRQTLRAARQLAESQEDSFLVYSESVLCAQIKDWTRMFNRITPVHDVGYNSVGRLLEGLRSEGVRLNVTAKQQIADLDHLALLGKGCDVVFSAAHKLGSHVKLAASCGISTFAFNVKEEVLKIRKHCTNARLVLQLDCSEVPNLVSLKSAVLAALELDHEVVGLHLDLPTSEDGLRQLEQWLRVARSLIDWGREQGAQMGSLHIGELTGTSFSDGFVGELEGLVEQLFPRCLQVNLSATASRFLVAPTFTLAARIMAHRTSPDSQVHYYINEGVFGAFTGNLMLEGGAVVQPPFPLGGGGKGRKGNRSQLHDTRIFGPSGDDELDLVLEDVFLPRLEEDDWLLFPGLAALNSQEFVNHSNVRGTSNYIYTKLGSAEMVSTVVEKGEPEKAACWNEINLCETREINLDLYELFSLGSVFRGDLYQNFF